MKKKLFLYFLFITNTLFALQTPYKALIITPVADLAGQSLSECNKNSVISIYKNLTLCGKKGEFACPRVHQALLHEYVTVLEEHGDEIMVKINNLYFETNNDTTKHDTFWTLKKNVMSLACLEKHGINLSLLPEPIEYEKKKPTQQNSITLLAPYKEPMTGHLFSAGTRFVQAPAANKDYRTVYVLDVKKMRMHTLELPKTITVCTHALTNKEKLNLFVRLCQKWATTQNGFIAYVWGGCSITHLYQHDAFTLQEAKDFRGKSISFFKRNEIHHPHGGLDCAGLVARAAQTAGLPYYYKNTTTLAKHLAPHRQETKLQPGDLIWFSGHVMIIGNLEKNTVIEARHYSHGYGKVHELPLSKVFKDMKTFDTLKQAYLKKKPLIRLDKHQKPVQTINHFKLLQMNSIF